MTSEIPQPQHTIVVSDLHLADAEPAHPTSPLWKKFRREDYFIDSSFQKFLNYMQKKIGDDPIELILNGDIFDFDSITALPEKEDFSIGRYEKKFGLDSTQEKSLFKMKLILRDHHLWFKAISDFLKNNNSVIFVIGNHDAELYWPKVQVAIIEALQLNEDERKRLRFCEWFYVSGADTLIEHGHQYDPYCLTIDPVHPAIRIGKEYKVRLPFGNLANRYMVNGMGLKNPHSDDSFVKTSREFAEFFFKYEIKVQPLMIATWFFGAIRSFVTTLSEGLHPPQKDPLTFDERIKKIARKANSEPTTVLVLKENHAHPAAHRPLQLLRELWLDRAFLLILIVWGCWQVFSTSYVFIDVSLWWFSIPVLLLLPFFFYYAHGVQSDVRKFASLALEKIPLSAKAVGVSRVINGHTHLPDHFQLGEIEYLNTGSWTPRFRDPECTIEYGEKHFAWIDASDNRVMKLCTWHEDHFKLCPKSDGQN